MGGFPEVDDADDAAAPGAQRHDQHRARAVAVQIVLGVVLGVLADVADRHAPAVQHRALIGAEPLAALRLGRQLDGVGAVVRLARPALRHAHQPRAVVREQEEGRGGGVGADAQLIEGERGELVEGAFAPARGVGQRDEAADGALHRAHDAREPVDLGDARAHVDRPVELEPADAERLVGELARRAPDRCREPPGESDRHGQRAQRQRRAPDAHGVVAGEQGALGHEDRHVDVPGVVHAEVDRDDRAEPRPVRDVDRHPPVPLPVGEALEQRADRRAIDVADRGRVELAAHGGAGAALEPLGVVVADELAVAGEQEHLRVVGQRRRAEPSRDRLERQVGTDHHPAVAHPPRERRADLARREEAVEVGHDGAVRRVRVAVPGARPRVEAGHETVLRAERLERLVVPRRHVPRLIEAIPLDALDGEGGAVGHALGGARLLAVRRAAHQVEVAVLEAEVHRVELRVAVERVGEVADRQRQLVHRRAGGDPELRGLAHERLDRGVELGRPARDAARDLGEERLGRVERQRPVALEAVEDQRRAERGDQGREQRGDAEAQGVRARRARSAETAQAQPSERRERAFSLGSVRTARSHIRGRCRKCETVRVSLAASTPDRHDGCYRRELFPLCNER